MTYETYQHPSLLLFFCCGNRRRNRAEYVQPLRKSSHFQFLPPRCWRVSWRMAVGDSELFGQSFSGRLILSCCTKATGIADIKINNHRCSNNKSELKAQDNFEKLFGNFEVKYIHRRYWIGIQPNYDFISTLGRSSVD